MLLYEIKTLALRKPMHQCLHFRVSSQLSRHILCSLGFQPNSAWSSGFHHGSHTSNGKCGIAPLMITSKTTHQPKHIMRIRFFISSNALIQSQTAKEIKIEARKLWGFTSSSNMCISQLSSLAKLQSCFWMKQLVACTDGAQNGGTPRCAENCLATCAPNGWG